MKMTFSVATLVAGLSVLAGSGLADEAKVSTSDRPTIRDERPENVSGWVIVSKSSYWPLCYEALENLTKVREQAGSSDKAALSATLDKCSAWLQLAASAAMVKEEARIMKIADTMDEVSTSLQDNDSAPSSREIEVLATMGELAVAKSHLIRATADYVHHKTAKTPAAKKGVSANIVAEEKEIQKARMERDRDQYRYDTGQSLRHLTVALAYLRAVAEQGEIELGEFATETVEPLSGTENASDLVNKDKEIRDFVERLMAFIEAQQVRLGAEFKWEPKAVVETVES
ncbi:hypothetical protein Mal15_59190 [Stieleria maiorica]|uniref:Secreted protein n=1 Tax=Stieleria maiorica TaxID=2795974 RepID=A0A5B9MRZ6_9BACT|nr:hypothetical protein [Stieleria maiorica]QEG01838.1 hypothetical protein Mal15_59190 [Stieleria maiorica]